MKSNQVDGNRSWYLFPPTPVKSGAPRLWFVGTLLLGFTVGATVDLFAASADIDKACPPVEIESARVLDPASSIIVPGRQLLLKLKDFDAWFSCWQQSKAPIPVLYLDHILRPDLGAVADPAGKGLRYSLLLTEGNRLAWTANAAKTAKGQGVAIGVGNGTAETSFVTDSEVPGQGNASTTKIPFQMTLIDSRMKIVGWSFIAGFVILSIVVAWLTRLVRDRGALVSGATEWKRTYSLARTQLFLWSVAVASVTGFIWLATGLLPALNIETLALLGISAGTSGAASLIEAKSAMPVTVRPTAGFFLLDLLNDGSGASIHRFQAVVANFGLAIIFAIESISKLDFYSIPPSWTALLSLSSGVYLGFKVGEPG